MENKNLTAVEWLEDKLNSVKPTQFCSIETIKEWIKQAKEMEKQQIIDAHGIKTTHGFENGMSWWNQKSGEQYYNETYKSE